MKRWELKTINHSDGLPVNQLDSEDSLMPIYSLVDHLCIDYGSSLLFSSLVSFSLRYRQLILLIVWGWIKCCVLLTLIDHIQCKPTTVHREGQSQS